MGRTPTITPGSINEVRFYALCHALMESIDPRHANYSAWIDDHAADGRDILNVLIAFIENDPCAQTTSIINNILYLCEKPQVVHALFRHVDERHPHSYASTGHSLILEKLLARDYADDVKLQSAMRIADGLELALPAKDKTRQIAALKRHLETNPAHAAQISRALDKKLRKAGLTAAPEREDPRIRQRSLLSATYFADAIGDRARAETSLTQGVWLSYRAHAGFAAIASVALGGVTYSTISQTADTVAAASSDAASASPISPLAVSLVVGVSMTVACTALISFSAVMQGRRIVKDFRAAVSRER